MAFSVKLITLSPSGSSAIAAIIALVSKTISMRKEYTISKEKVKCTVYVFSYTVYIELYSHRSQHSRHHSWHRNRRKTPKTSRGDAKNAENAEHLSVNLIFFQDIFIFVP
jgi:hypothetical protein